MKTINVLICATGSVATIKLPEIIHTLKSKSTSEYTVNVRYCLTEKARHFITEPIAGSESFTDEDEWSKWKSRGDPVLHIELSKWAHILVIAPMDANSLAKVANGICDNLVLCIIRAWGPKPLIYCPAMNTTMWEHPITASHIETLDSWGYMQVPPIAKQLMCGDTGMGAMAEVEVIVEFITRNFVSALMGLHNNV